MDFCQINNRSKHGPGTHGLLMARRGHGHASASYNYILGCVCVEICCREGERDSTYIHDA
jgi:hypothetical protein